mmetsp:Transcript_2883/g.8117  ORF Transcript_2883/g.8117 Transcript_2883/m.8117 type:complete len:231 (-) Transcript_2883:160-852(-)
MELNVFLPQLQGTSGSQPPAGVGLHLDDCKPSPPCPLLPQLDCVDLLLQSPPPPQRPTPGALDDHGRRVQESLLVLPLPPQLPVLPAGKPTPGDLLDEDDCGDDVTLQVEIQLPLYPAPPVPLDTSCSGIFPARALNEVTLPDLQHALPHQVSPDDRLETHKARVPPRAVVSDPYARHCRLPLTAPRGQGQRQLRQVNNSGRYRPALAGCSGAHNQSSCIGQDRTGCGRW